MNLSEEEKKLIKFALEIYAGELTVVSEALVSPVLKRQFAAQARQVRQLAHRFDENELKQKASEIMQLRSKIDAIKYVREVTGLGLRESKEFVDALEK